MGLFAGLTLESSEMSRLSKMRRDYHAKLEAVDRKAEHLTIPIEPECPSSVRGSILSMPVPLSTRRSPCSPYRWPIYSMDSKDPVYESPQALHLPNSEVSGAKKLRSFAAWRRSVDFARRGPIHHHTCCITYLACRFLPCHNSICTSHQSPVSDGDYCNLHGFMNGIII